MKNTAKRILSATSVVIVIETGSFSSFFFGFIALCGWVFGFPILTRLHKAYLPMAPSTALFFCLFGILLIISHKTRWKGGWQIAVKGIVFAATAAALLLLVFALFGIQVEFENLGMSIEGNIAGYPVGHMSPVTAFCFLIAGVSLLLLFMPQAPSKRRFYIALGGGMLVLLLSMVLLIAYVIGGSLLYNSTAIPPALSTSLAFLGLGAALTGKAVLQKENANKDNIEESENTSSILLQLAILASLFVVVSSFFIFRSHADYYRREAGRDLVSIADLKVHELVQWRSERLGDADTLFGNVFFSKILQDYYENQDYHDIPETIKSWLSRIIEAYGYENVSFYEPKGTLIWMFPDTRTPVLSMEIIDEVLEQKQVALLDFQRNIPGGPVFMTALAPIYANEELSDELGVIALRIDPQQFLFPLIQRWPTDRNTAETLLVRRDGDDAVFLNDLRFRDNAPLELHLPLSSPELPAAMAIKGREGAMEGVDYRGERVLAVLRPVPDSPWSLVAKIDTSELYAPLRTHLYGIIGLVVALLGAIGGFFVGAWHHKRKEYYQKLYHTEKKRKRVEELHRIVVQSIGEGVITVDSEGRVKMLNPMAERLTGWTEQEAYLRSIEEVFQIVNEDTGEPGPGPVEMVLSHGRTEVLANHTLLISKDGRKIPIACSAAPIKDEEGKLYGVVLDFRDQSKEREAMTKLKESEERFRLTLHNSSLIVATCDRELRYTWIYNPHPDFVGDEVIGKRDDELSPNKGTRRLMELKQTVVEGGGELREEIAFPASEEEQIYDVVARAITDERSKVVGVTTVAWDVTALKELEIRYSCLYNSIKDAIVIADTDQEILDCNPAFTSLFGYSLDEVKGSKVGFLLSEPEEYKEICREIEEHRDKPESTRIVSYRKENGELFRGETSFFSLSDEFRGIWGATWVIRDVTDRELMERQLFESQKMEALGQLAGGIAHDFNNVLTAISGASQILDRRTEGGSSAKKLIAAIRSSIKRGNAVTERMLTFTRSVEPETKPVLLVSLLSEFQEIAIHSLPRDVHVSIGKVSDRQWVYVDPVQFQQVLFTLSINASDAMPEGGDFSFNVRRPTVQEVHVHVGEENTDPKNYWCLEVSDEGVGMDEEIQRHIFEPFFTTKDSTKGTGLGLAVVFKILRMNKGWIDVYSTPGSGSTFILGLPAAEAVSGQPASPEAVKQGGGETLLVVDDEDTICDMLEAVLSGHGYRIITGKTAEEGLKFLEEEGTKINLVITDIGLPDMNGKKLIAEIKTQYPNLPIIAMTGYMEEKLEETLHAAGADVVVRKPYDIDELSTHIYKLLR